VLLTLAEVGSQLAHEPAYRLMTLDGDQQAHELGRRGHARLTCAPTREPRTPSLLVLNRSAGQSRRPSNA